MSIAASLLRRGLPLACVLTTFVLCSRAQLSAENKAAAMPTYSDSLINVESITIKPYYEGAILIANVYNKAPYMLTTTIINVNCYDEHGVQTANATFVINDLPPNTRAIKKMTGSLSTKPTRLKIMRVSHL
jgi:hypothetical protein